MPAHARASPVLRLLLISKDRAGAALIRDALAPRCTCKLVTSVGAGLEVLARNDDDLDAIVFGSRPSESIEPILDAARRRRVPVPVLLAIDAVDDEGSEEHEVLSNPGLLVLVKPVDSAMIQSAIQAAARAIIEEAAKRTPLPAATPDAQGRQTRPAEAVVIGASDVFLAALAAVDAAAQSVSPIVLLGESGSGKSMLAERIHARGPRRNRPFVVYDPALTARTPRRSGFGPKAPDDPSTSDESLQEVELSSNDLGVLFERAEGGTLFVRDVTALPFPVQSQLLTRVELAAGDSVGGRRHDVRVLVGTKSDLRKAFREGNLREDLFFRLHSLVIRVPPLRDRREDIVALSRYLLERAQTRTPRSKTKLLSAAAEAVLSRGQWPGNVRELAARIERAVVFGTTEQIEPADVAETLDEEPVPPWLPGNMCSLRELTERYSRWVLGQTGGDRRRAATILGVDVSTMYRWQRRDSSE